LEGAEENNVLLAIEVFGWLLSFYAGRAVHPIVWEGGPKMDQLGASTRTTSPRFRYRMRTHVSNQASLGTSLRRPSALGLPGMRPTGFASKAL
jgi:hypothetical protein